MQFDLMKLFDGYVRNYHTFHLTVDHGKHSFTMTEIEYFSRLGSMLGYHAYTEDTCNGLNRPMDLTWWDGFDGTYWHDFILHLERENYFKKDMETLEKLFCKRELSPMHAIGILNVPNYERIEELLQHVKKMCNVPQAMLIFRTYSQESDKNFFDEVYTYVFHQKKCVATEKAYVSEVFGVLHMHE